MMIQERGAALPWIPVLSPQNIHRINRWRQVRGFVKGLWRNRWTSGPGRFSFVVLHPQCLPQVVPWSFWLNLKYILSLTLWIYSAMLKLWSTVLWYAWGLSCQGISEFLFPGNTLCCVFCSRLLLTICQRSDLHNSWIYTRFTLTRSASDGGNSLWIDLRPSLSISMASLSMCTCLNSWFLVWGFFIACLLTLICRWPTVPVINSRKTAALVACIMIRLVVFDGLLGGLDVHTKPGFIW